MLEASRKDFRVAGGRVENQHKDNKEKRQAIRTIFFMTLFIATTSLIVLALIVHSTIQITKLRDKAHFIKSKRLADQKKNQQ